MSKQRKPRTRQVIPNNETPEARYKRVITPKVEKVLFYIRNISNITGGNRYSMNEEDILKIVSAIELETKRISESFNLRNEPKKKEGIKFSL